MVGPYAFFVSLVRGRYHISTTASTRGVVQSHRWFRTPELCRTGDACLAPSISQRALSLESASAVPAASMLGSWE